ncbi:hypothetical protein K432DRAFT_384107 [Lepidopterella palustris CBS 459.81]|uniref:Uncharacterized protein n=1 Tax=Lepidopterella palustris CBS 459.81 TaxID=1314670 RepID=A0A8E2JD20_9PEZI|nr:hypothetical protein K432DRAFT_384107 [Lepidopterella palustris CBS 459.81]
METQAISNKYIDKSILSRLLSSLFGYNYIVDAQYEDFILTIPRRLTEDEIKQLQKDSNPK